MSGQCTKPGCNRLPLLFSDRCEQHQHRGNDLVATNPDATTSPANPQGRAEQELNKYHHIDCSHSYDSTTCDCGLRKAITKRTAASYSQGYDDCLKEHGAVFKGEEK